MLPITVLCLAILFLAFLGRGADGSWVGPGPLFSLIWALYPFSAAFWITEPASFTVGVLWIWFSVLALYVGSAFAQPFVRSAATLLASSATPPPVNDAARRTLRWMSGLAIALGALNVLNLFVANGMSPRAIVNVAIVAQLTAQIRADTFTGELETSYAQRFAFVGLFLGTIYGGLLFRVAARFRDRLLGVGTLLVIIALYGIMGSRMGVLYGGTFWLAAYLAAHVALAAPGEPVSSRILLKFGLAGVAVIFGLSSATLVLRYSSAVESPNWFYVLSDPFGYVAAFGIWFEKSGMWFHDLYYGGRTFLRPFEFLGIEYERQPVIWVGFTSSNLYTIFRDLIEDFNPVGSTTIFLLFGFVARLLFVRVSTAPGRRRHLALPWLFFAYAFILTSVTSGLLMYTSPTLAVVIFIATFRFFPVLVQAHGPGRGGPPADER
jgi:hypothetical protein